MQQAPIIENGALTTAADLPEFMSSLVQQAWRRYAEAAVEARLGIPQDAGFQRVLSRVWSTSEFVSQHMVQSPQLLDDLLKSGDLLGDYAAGEMYAKASAALAKVKDSDTLAAALRLLRKREMVRIAWRDLAGWAPLAETLRDLSDLADACVCAALDVLFPWHCKAFGTPKRADGSTQSMVVLGMGKLGAGELNFSSDIDLIFAFPESGQMRKRGGISNDEFFVRLGQELISALDDRTADGFVYRVDMRLRPYGDSGPLAMSFDALEEYYQSAGREWERYAMVKARPIAGDPAQAKELMATLTPFVYRRYLDYGAFEQLREMKAMIEQEVRRKQLDDNVKLGAGGIREVEFIAQVFQLVRGGRDHALRVRSLRTVLRLLAERDLIDKATAQALDQAYCFLRLTENRIQAWADEQTHRLPKQEEGRQRLAYSMGYEDWASFVAELDRHRSLVRGQFEQIFSLREEPVEDASEAPLERLSALWEADLPRADTIAALEELEFAEAAESADRLRQFRQGYAHRAMGSRGRARLAQLMPRLLLALAEINPDQEVLMRLIRLLEAVAGRSAYLALLAENRGALSQLVRLCAASPWVAAELTGHPLLLDQLLDPRTLYQPLERAELDAALEREFESVEAGDLEREMEVLRQFKQATVLHVAAADLAGATPLMVVSDYLTNVAEVVLNKVSELAWRHLLAKYGAPACGRGRKRRQAGFAIVAYGKLGGIELGYGSDLDLVFLHDSAGADQYTEGPKSIDNAVFFARLGQRIIHYLNTLTPGGVLYEVDMRLRPSGASGLLVSDLDAFADYQRKEAWTWEHQALVRARVVSGDSALAARFATIRQDILSQERDPEALRVEVRDMRERMRRELAKSKPGMFDLKQAAGGIADIEFMVQYGVLRWACEHPALLEYSDNIRILAALAQAGLFTDEDVQALSDAYRAYRKRLHRLTLQEERGLAPREEFADHANRVLDLWRTLMDSPVH